MKRSTRAAGTTPGRNHYHTTPAPTTHRHYRPPYKLPSHSAERGQSAPPPAHWCSLEGKDDGEVKFSKGTAGNGALMFAAGTRARSPPPWLAPMENFSPCPHVVPHTPHRPLGAKGDSLHQNCTSLVDGVGRLQRGEASPIAVLLQPGPHDLFLLCSLSKFHQKGVFAISARVGTRCMV